MPRGRVDGAEIRRTVKHAALAALARKPGRPGTPGDWQLEAARAEITQLTEAVKAGGTGRGPLISLQQK